MSPTRRSLAHLRSLGFVTELVEQRIPQTFIPKDLWGADMLAAKPGDTRSCGHLLALVLGIDGARPVIQLNEVPVPAFLVVRAGIEDRSVAVTALDLLRVLPGRCAAKRQAHENQGDGYLVTFAHTPPPDFENDQRLLSSHPRVSEIYEAICWPESRRKNSGIGNKGNSTASLLTALSSRT